jgi:putative transposase
MSEIKSSRHSRYNINYHIVWIPKYRRAILNEEVKKRLTTIFQEIMEEKGIEVLAQEIMPDHIHIFISSPPKNSPSLIVNWLKGISARIYNHRHYPKIKWTRSYYVGTAGTVTAETIKKYIQEQTNK